MELFFEKENTHTEEDHRNLLLSTKKFSTTIPTSVQSVKLDKASSKIVLNNNNNNNNNTISTPIKESEYPIYFRQVKINDTELVLSFFLSEESSFVNKTYLKVF